MRLPYRGTEGLSKLAAVPPVVSRVVPDLPAWIQLMAEREATGVPVGHTRAEFRAGTEGLE